MPQRIASILAILAFAICLIVGGISAGNPFGTTVSRALVAMAGTFVVGWVIGWMIEKMNTTSEKIPAADKIENKTPAHSR